MSGTSIDGIDVAFVEITVIDRSTDNPEMHARPVGHREHAFTDDLRKQVQRVRTDRDLSISDICRLNVLLGEAYAAAVAQATESLDIVLTDIAAVGVHGQTVWHSPPSAAAGYSGTLQLGEPAVVAETLCVPVVSNFRARDVAAGGEGAPLVPFADHILFANHDEARVVLNLGGIANITYLPAGRDLTGVIAFDTGPANMVMDLLAQRLLNIPHDHEGRRAAQGTVDEGLLAHWLRDPYFQLVPPKSTGFETFGPGFIEAACSSGKSTEDLLRTALELTVTSIASALCAYLPCAPHRIIAGGGGVRNPFLMERLREALAPVVLSTHEDYGIPSQAKEAIAFAILAAATINDIPANVPSATGAGGPRRLGSVTYP